MSIYRFKLDDAVVDAITIFAKVHQYDSNKDYKKFWSSWCEENSTLIRCEVDRLNEIGYTGDSMDKMYKAGRYYFRKKPLTNVIEPKQRRLYISMNSDVLDAMDEHIRERATEDSFTPAQGYEWFCTKHSEMLNIEICRLVADDINITQKEIVAKIKKTYKNRYFIYTKSQ